MNNLVRYGSIALLAAGALVAAQQIPRPDSKPAPPPIPDDAVCALQGTSASMPGALAETSGLALGAGNRLWTHNDGDKPILFALDATGTVVQDVRVEGVKLDDWEDLASAPCASGTCLYIADTGDNDGRRRDIAVHIVPEPAPGARTVRSTSTTRARYPDAPQDAEALFVLKGEVFLVTKGRHAAIAIYRVPQSATGDAVVLERVRELSGRPDNPFDLVTGATATPDGRWIAIRTYRGMMLYPAQQLVGAGAVTPVQVDLSPLQHGQGESVVLDDAGNAWFTSEDEIGSAPLLAHMKCRLEQ